MTTPHASEWRLLPTTRAHVCLSSHELVELSALMASISTVAFAATAK
jgi:hypothetical protein